MVDTLNEADVRSGLLSEFTKSKGLASFDDEEEEPLRQLEDQHQLSIHVEHCDCIRPSHHLRGSRGKYTQYFADVSVYMQKFEGAGEVVVKANQAEWSGLPQAQPAAQATDMLAQSMQAKPKRPASAAPSGRTPLQPMALPGGVGDQFGFLTPQQGRWPRVGSFEVNYTLLNVKSKASYGPYLLSSKLMTERWPNEAKVHGHLQDHLQLLLKQDEQHYALEKMVRTKIDEKKALAAEAEPAPAVYSEEDLRAPGFATAAPPAAAPRTPPAAPPPAPVAVAAPAPAPQAEQAPVPAVDAPEADAPEADAPTPAPAPAADAPTADAPAMDAPAMDAPVPAPADLPEAPVEATPEAATPEAASADVPPPAPEPAMPPANLNRGDTFFAQGGRAA